MHDIVWGFLYEAGISTWYPWRYGDNTEKQFENIETEPLAAFHQLAYDLPFFDDYCSPEWLHNLKEAETFLKKKEELLKSETDCECGGVPLKTLWWQLPAFQYKSAINDHKVRISEHEIAREWALREDKNTSRGTFPLAPEICEVLSLFAVTASSCIRVCCGVQHILGRDVSSAFGGYGRDVSNALQAMQKNKVIEYTLNNYLYLIRYRLAHNHYDYEDVTRLLARVMIDPC
jgi:hypothetical protein